MVRRRKWSATALVVFDAALPPAEWLCDWLHRKCSATGCCISAQRPELALPSRLAGKPGEGTPLVAGAPKPRSDEDTRARPRPAPMPCPNGHAS